MEKREKDAEKIRGKRLGVNEKGRSTQRVLVRERKGKIRPRVENWKRRGSRKKEYWKELV